MEWDEPLRERLYAAIQGKLKKIREDCRDQGRSTPLDSAERFYLVRKIYSDHMDSLGVLTARWKKSRKVPPHWVVRPGVLVPPTRRTES
jgi:hypothetical protein